MPSDFSTLGISETASPETARDAWLRLVRLHHPDLTGAEIAAQGQMAEINAAYDRIRKRAEQHPEPGPSTGTRTPDTGQHGTMRHQIVLVNRALERMMLQAMLDATRFESGIRGRLGIASVRQLPGMHVAHQVEHRKGSLVITFSSPAVSGRNLIAMPRISAWANGTLRVSADKYRTFEIHLPASPDTAFSFERAGGFVDGFVKLSATLCFPGDGRDPRPELLARTGVRAWFVGGRSAYRPADHKAATREDR